MVARAIAREGSVAVFFIIISNLWVGWRNGEWSWWSRGACFRLRLVAAWPGPMNRARLAAPPLRRRARRAGRYRQVPGPGRTRLVSSRRAAVDLDRRATRRARAACV